MDDLQARLEAVAETDCAYCHGLNISCPEGCALATASALADAVAEIAEWKQSFIAFAGPFARHYAQDYDLPEGHLHPVHYDLLEKAGARMVSFTRAALGYAS